MAFQIWLISSIICVLSASANFNVPPYIFQSVASEMDGSASFAYKAGILFASTASAFVNEDNALWEDEEAVEEDCQHKTSSQLSDELKDMLNFKGNLLKQVLYGTPKVARANICRVYNSQTGTLMRCFAAEESPLAPILMMLQTVCVQFDEVLSQHAECLSDMEYARFEEQCVNACKPPTVESTPAPTVEVPQNTSIIGEPSPPAYKPTDAMTAMSEVCDISACAINCVGALISECGESGPSAVVALKQFIDQLEALQMLYAISTQIKNRVGVTALLRGGVPPKCAQIMSKAIATSNFVSGHDLQPATSSINHRPSFMDMLNTNKMGENFARS